jgi:hypothetical protein
MVFGYSSVNSLKHSVPQFVPVGSLGEVNGKTY